MASKNEYLIPASPRRASASEVPAFAPPPRDSPRKGVEEHPPSASKGISTAHSSDRSPRGNKYAYSPVVSSPPPASASPAPAAIKKQIVVEDKSVAKKSSSPVDMDLLIDPKDLVMGGILGSGGFGAVHRGHYRSQEVAVKKLHMIDGQVTPAQLEEFRKEVANLKALRHTRLVSFIGAAYTPPSLCIVTEFMPNGSLYDLLHNRKEPLIYQQRLALSVQVSEGVEFLHGLTPPFVHRDLKSMNVVLDFELNAKLCDFGLTESMEKTHISRRDNEGGSPRYMAPELFKTNEKITEKVDIWALGCLVLEIFTNKLPHGDCQSIQQVVAKLMRHELPYKDWRGVGIELQTLAELCLDFQPKRRADAAQFVEGLRGLKE